MKHTYAQYAHPLDVRGRGSSTSDVSGSIICWYACMHDNFEKREREMRLVFRSSSASSSYSVVARSAESGFCQLEVWDSKHLQFCNLRRDLRSFLVSRLHRGTSMRLRARSLIAESRLQSNIIAGEHGSEWFRRSRYSRDYANSRYYLLYRTFSISYFCGLLSAWFPRYYIIACFHCILCRWPFICRIARTKSENLDIRFRSWSFAVINRDLLYFLYYILYFFDNSFRCMRLECFFYDTG